MVAKIKRTCNLTNRVRAERSLCRRSKESRHAVSEFLKIYSQGEIVAIIAFGANPYSPIVVFVHALALLASSPTPSLTSLVPLVESRMTLHNRISARQTPAAEAPLDLLEMSSMMAAWPRSFGFLISLPYSDFNYIRLSSHVMALARI